MNEDIPLAVRSAYLRTGNCFMKLRLNISIIINYNKYDCLIVKNQNKSFSLFFCFGPFLLYCMDRPPSVKVKRSESLKKLTKDQLPLSPLSPRSELPLKQVIDEVLKHLIEIIEMLLL